MTTSFKQTMIAARAVIENPAHWCQGNMAVDWQGNEVAPNDPNAIRHCAEGALCKVADQPYGLDYDLSSLLNDAADILFGIADFVEINDRNGHAAILAVFDRAIADQKGE